MKKNDIFELEITDMGVDGEGIGHYDGMTFFVKDALIGDVIRARAVKLKKNYGCAICEPRDTAVCAAQTLRGLPDPGALLREAVGIQGEQGQK